MSISISPFNHLRIPLDEIQKATNNFSEKNIIGKGGFGNVYKGQLLRCGKLINVSIRMVELNMELLTEVSVLSRFKHPNIVSLIGFCDEKDKIIVTRHEAKGSLSNYLSDQALTWIQRLKICRGVANAISYTHHVIGRSYSIIHQNINSDTILLDDDFEAKLSGFEFSIKVSVDRTERYIPTVVNPNPGYTNPETLKTKHPTQKSDIYSFGVVVYEIMCGKRISTLKNDPRHFEVDNLPDPYPIILYHLKLDMLHGILIPDMLNQMEPDSCRLFVRSTFKCLDPDPVQRISMNDFLIVLNRLLEDQLRKITPVTSTIQGVHISRTQEKIDQISKSKIAKLVEVNKLEHLRIELRDIQSATNYFSKESELWSEDHYGLLYKGELELFDKKCVSSLEGKNKGELPKRHYNVRILRIDNATAVDLFCKEIEILSTCKHDIIDSLLGFCDGEDSHMILVFEGNTYNHLSLLLKNEVLTWQMRLKICLDVARGLNYLRNKMVIHRQLSSYCIMLDDKMQETKITGFGLSTFHENQDEVPLRDYAEKGLLNGAGLRSMAPEIIKSIDGGMRCDMAKATKESDIYSFGVVMFEILWGASCTSLWAKDGEFRPEHWLKDEKIKQLVAEVLREENRGNELFLKKGPNKDSLDTFIDIAKRCLAVNREERPTLQEIIEQLEKALDSQKNHKDPLRMSLEVIKLATGSFDDANKIGSGSSGMVYKGKLAPEHGPSTIVAKRLGKRAQDQQFKNELHILSEYKHENVISLVGYTNDKQERIIVYEHASEGSLNKHLDKKSLTWINRLNICIDVARGLAFLHKGVRKHEAVIHRDMKPANILLFDDWKAKVADFGLSLICTVDDETDCVISYPNGTQRYLDPLYRKHWTLTKEYDIYSFGVVLLDILCGTSAEVQFFKQCYKEKRLDKVVVFKKIEGQIVPEALATFQAIAYQCLHDDMGERPKAQDVLVQLEKALELQVKDVPVSKES